MSLQLTFSDLVKEAVRLDYKEYNKFVATVSKLRAGQTIGSISKQESDLMVKINRGFPTENWMRIQILDSKMEENNLSQLEYDELTSLTDAYEKYCVQRLRLLKKLALLRNIPLEEAMNQLGLEHVKV